MGVQPAAGWGLQPEFQSHVQFESSLVQNAGDGVGLEARILV